MPKNWSLEKVTRCVGLSLSAGAFISSWYHLTAQWYSFIKCPLGESIIPFSVAKTIYLIMEPFVSRQRLTEYKPYPKNIVLNWLCSNWSDASFVYFCSCLSQQSVISLTSFTELIFGNSYLNWIFNYSNYLYSFSQ